MNKSWIFVCIGILYLAVTVSVWLNIIPQLTGLKMWGLLAIVSTLIFILPSQKKTASGPDRLTFINFDDWWALGEKTVEYRYGNLDIRLVAEVTIITRYRLSRSALVKIQKIREQGSSLTKIVGDTLFAYEGQLFPMSLEEKPTNKKDEEK